MNFNNNQIINEIKLIKKIYKHTLKYFKNISI